MTTSPPVTDKPRTERASVIVVDREGIAPAYVKHLSRDGSWVCTWDESTARRFSAELAERKAAALNAAARRPIFETRTAGTIE